MLRPLTLVVTIAGLLSAAGVPAVGADVANGEPLYLSVREPNLRYSPQSVGLLFREISRQAFLIAARDECGQSTRDFSLREEFPQLPNDKSPIFELQTLGKKWEPCDLRVYIKRKTDSARRVIWQTHLAVPPHGALVPLVEKAEELSRGEFKELLRKEGFAGPVPRSRAEGTVPEEVKHLLSHWSEIDSLHAIRLIHSEIRGRGESPELLAALAIAYANLGVLTDRQWSPAFKAYEARALLYAERLVRKQKASSWALAHRAYVRTLVGLHVAALADIEAVRAGQKNRAAGKPIPSWLDVLALFCQGKSATMLDAAKKEPEQSVALVLRMLEFDPTDAAQEIVDTSKAVLHAHPTCHRAAEGMCAAQILNTSHAAVGQSMEVCRKCIQEELKSYPDIPEAVKKRIVRLKDLEDSEERVSLFVELMSELKEAGRHDRSEPSLLVVQGLVQEMVYLAAFRQLHFEARMLGVPTAESLLRFRPLVAEHPYACNLETMSNDHAEYVAGANKLREVDFREIGFSEGRAIYMVIWSWQPEVDLIATVVNSHADETYRDLVSLRADTYLRHIQNDKSNADLAIGLRSTCPNFPVTASILIDVDWKVMQKDAPRLEKQFAEAPFVLTALSNKYIELKHWDDAERCLKQKIKALPSYQTYRSLATVYEKKGDMERWKETLEKSLELSSMDLESAHVRVDLAEYHIKRKEYRKALPYADEAAESYAAWALLEAARCHELLEDWSTAEKLVRAEAERYQGDSFKYMLWCHRTGHGDLKAAQELALHHFESLGTPAPADRLEDIGTYYLLTEEPEKALRLFQEAFKQTHFLWNAFHATLLCDRLGDAAGRDALLKTIATTEKPDRAHYVELAKLWRDALASGNPQSLDLGTIDRLAQKLKEKGEPTNLWYFVGEFLDIHGEKEKSREYLMRCATSPMPGRYNHMLARDALRKAKIAIGPLRDTEVPKP